jgi:hypothetical protein
MAKTRDTRPSRLEPPARAAAPPEPGGPPWRAPLDLTASLWYLAALLSFWTFGFTLRRQGDLWWHIAAGRWMWEHRSLPWTDPWSFTRAGQPWLHHEWLADLVYEGWVRLFGMNTLVYWKWGVMLAGFLLLLRLLHRLSGHVVAGYLASLLAVATSMPFLDIRPQLYSLLGYVVLLCLLLLRPRPSWLLPPLFLVWANLHGGFFFGLMALTVVLAVTALHARHSPALRRRAAGVWLASVAASLVNPYGIHAFGYPLKYALDPTSPFRVVIPEWSSPFSPGGIQAPLYPAAIATALGAAALLWIWRAWRDPRGLTLAALALTALTLAMSLRSRRFIPLFAISQSLMLAPVLARLLEMAGRHLEPGFGEILRHRVTRLGAPTLVAAASALWLLAHPPVPAAFPILTAEWSFPVGTTRFIQANRLSGKVFSEWTYGGYLQLHAPGRMKVFVDQRADTVFDAETYLRYLEVAVGTPGWIDVVEASGADYFFWPRDQGHAAALLRTGRWRKLHEDRFSVLLAREGVPPPEAGQAPRGPGDPAAPTRAAQ